MPIVLPFGAYEPDTADLETDQSFYLQNVVPRGDGYGPFPSFSVYSSALSGTCRGFFYARKADGSITVFAATGTKLYQLNNTTFTWTDVSKGGASYSSVPTADQWQFAQFNNFVFAVQINTAPQVFDLTSSTAFADLGGSPPQARYIAVVNRFLVLSGLGSSTPYRIQWSGLNATTTWTSGVNQSDFQDFPDGGIVRGVAGGEYGVIVQDAAVRRMTYAPGSPYTFQIDRISEEKGIIAPFSLVTGGDRVFWLGIDGFKMLVPGGYPQPIGKEKVDRTFLADLDQNALQLCIGCSDPKSTRVFWAYKSLAGQSGLFDKLLCYDYALERWSPVAMSGEYLSTLARPGLTLEALDNIAPLNQAITGAANNGSGLIRLTVATSTSQYVTGQIVSVSGVVGTTEANAENWKLTVIDGTHVDLQGSTFTNAYVSGGTISGSLDALTFSLDDVSVSAISALSGFNSAHQLGFYSGSNLEAILESAEHSGQGRRLRVNGMRPLSDAPTIYGAVAYRETESATPVLSTEQIMDARGVCPARRSTRYARGRIRIPAGTAWNYAEGLDCTEPLILLEGGR